MENADLLEQAKRYSDESYALCYEELRAMRERVEWLEDEVKRIVTNCRA